VDRAPLRICVRLDDTVLVVLGGFDLEEVPDVEAENVNDNTGESVTDLD